MSALVGADVLDVGMITSLGLRAATTAAAVRAGLNRFRDSPLIDSRFRPFVMAHLPIEDLAPLAPTLPHAWALGLRRVRMLCLAGAALREALANEPRVERIPVLLAFPDAHPGHAAPAGEGFLADLALQAELPFDVARSKLFPNGRAGGLMALAEGLERLRAGTAGRVLVGGVDTYFDLDLLKKLAAEGRIRGRGTGFIPGEGAAFLLLTTPGGARRTGRAALARITGSAHALEPGHHHSELPHRGDGLAAAFARLFDAGAAEEPVQTVYAGLDGEHLFAREWGVASLRHQDRFVDDAAIEHPMDCLGDVGAALGPVLTGLAALGIQGGYRRSPCLVWCSSDRAERGAAIVREA